MRLEDVFFPKKCFGCGEGGGYFCKKCVGRFSRRELVCPECVRPSIGGWVHGRCKRALGLDRLIVPFGYRGPLQRALKSVKFRSSWDVLREVVEVVWDEVGGILSEVDDGWAIVPVPMYRAKQRMRGFNQAEVLGRCLAEKQKGRILLFLGRVRETESQYGLSRKDRARNLRGAFLRIGDVKGKKILLVDDVWTTGSTMRECCKVLKRGGAKEVWGLCVGR